ncbi:MAG TPA: hypothetical protein VFC13_21325, partial [Actinomycetes bacterium]|nr:hypothetical protein [Actinomycetes bacterium]
GHLGLGHVLVVAGPGLGGRGEDGLGQPVGDQFTAPAPDPERLSYAWSVVSCLPAAMGDPETAATGAVMRPATLARYAKEAGFRSTEPLPLSTDVWRFYRLTP